MLDRPWLNLQQNLITISSFSRPIAVFYLFVYLSRVENCNSPDFATKLSTCIGHLVEYFPFPNAVNLSQIQYLISSIFLDKAFQPSISNFCNQKIGCCKTFFHDEFVDRQFIKLSLSKSLKISSEICCNPGFLVIESIVLTDSIV